MEKVMLTGATGFIGSHIADRLIALGADLSLYVRRTTDTVRSLQRRGARVFIGLPDDLDSLRRATSGTTTIIHCAGATRAMEKHGYYQANVGFTRNILKLLERGQEIVFMSSQAAAGPSPGGRPIDEDAPPFPLSDYGHSKLAAEDAIRQWGEAHDKRYIILRPCVVYGPQDKDLYQFFRLACKGLHLVPSEERRFSLIHVSDLVEALLLALRNSPPGEIYFVANDRPYTWTQINRTISGSSHRSCTFRLPLPDSLLDVSAFVSELVAVAIQRPALLNRQKALEMKQSSWWCSNEKIKLHTGWRPNINLDDGVMQTLEWYRRSGWL